MIKRCSRCGAPAPDDVSAFCNRCGARLPSVMYCRKCGTPVADPESRFCDRCGSPLQPRAPVAVPPITLAKGKVCPACGFENFIPGARFCKKCGSDLETGGDTGPFLSPQERAAGPLPAVGSSVRQGPAGRKDAASPARGPVAVPVQPAGGPWAVQDLPRESRQDEGPAPGKSPGSYRKIALVAAAIIILLLIVTAIIFIGIPALSGNSSANATAPALIGSLLPDAISGYEPVINQSTPVIVDTPLNVK